MTDICSTMFTGYIYAASAVYAHRQAGKSERRMKVNEAK